MNTESTVKIEQTGGLPVILKVLSELNLAEKIDRYFQLHGNWEGESKGFIVQIRISYIISTCDHRLSHLEDWVAGRQKSLESLLGQPVRIKGFTDDKLGACWTGFQIYQHGVNLNRT